LCLRWGKLIYCIGPLKGVIHPFGRGKSSQIVGPAIFGLTYMNTVSTFPRAIFLLSAAVMLMAVGLLSLVRLEDVALVNLESEAEVEGADWPFLVRDETLFEERDGAKVMSPFSPVLSS
jgi:hypothetical protein